MSGGLSGAASSCGGSTVGASEPLINLDELSDEQILTLVNETAIAVERLHMETVMFEKFYEKLDKTPIIYKFGKI